MFLPVATAPTGFDEVIVESTQARSVFLLWEAPAQPNGVLVVYTVLQNEREIANVTPPTVDYNVTELLPYTNYQFSILACTSAGCVEGPSVDVTTNEDSEYFINVAAYVICHFTQFQYRRELKLPVSGMGYQARLLFLGMLPVILMESSCNTSFKEHKMEVKNFPTFTTRMPICSAFMETQKYNPTQITAIVL